MSSSTNDSNDRGRISKVIISPISDEAIVVRIKNMSADEKEEQNIRMSSDHSKPFSRNPGENEFRSKSTITDGQKTTSSSCQTRPDLNAIYSKSTMTDNQNKSSNSAQTSRKKLNESPIKTDNEPAPVPCLKHAALNISRKAADIPSEKINLCNNCSKSMLSYIFVVQDFLDSLAKEISGGEAPACLECARQELRNSLVSSSEVDIDNKQIVSSKSVTTSKNGRSRTDAKSKEDYSDRTSSKKTSRARNHEPVKKGVHHKGASVSTYPHQQTQQLDFVYNVSPPSSLDCSKDIPAKSDANIVINQGNSDHQTPKDPQSASPQNIYHHQQDTGTDGHQEKVENQSHGFVHSSESQYSEAVNDHHQEKVENQSHGFVHASESQYSEAVNDHHQGKDESGTHQHFQHSHQASGESGPRPIFRAPMERFQPNYDVVNPDNQNQQDHNNNFPEQVSPSLFREVDGIVSTLSNIEREVYDSARNTAGWEGLTEPHERLEYPPSSNTVSKQAFVTSCRNNAEAIGCLVVGTSLLLCRTTRTLCVLVSDGVSTAFRGALSAVFQVVQNVRSLDSLGTTKLALLEQPELGISFDKLNIWRLDQFNKCVYLNPDTLVIQNCDELFNHDELSAVPDIGWPDCFNSGVFVFSPSAHTFWQLMEFAEKQGSFDGGDQGLLNSYFNTWSSDISKKLSFIYNLMANVSYTYTPAFRQFGRNVKIVQFHGSFKPWHVKFFPTNGQISPSSPVHPTYVQFVHIWLNIFRISVLRLMTQEIQSYAASQETICAVEILRFFPLPTESEAEFFLTPPSVRLRLAEKKLTRSTSLPISEARRRKSAEFLRYVDPGESIEESSFSPHRDDPKNRESETKDAEVQESSEPVGSTSNEPEKEKSEDKISQSDEVFEEKEVGTKKKVRDENSLPGAEVGNYQGMKAWEQGRMDYEGSDSSDNVIKRLQFLMSRQK